MTIAALDVELCDCFVEYGGVTAEMLLLFTFVLLGSSLIWIGFTVISGPVLLFAGFALLIRTPVYLLSLLGSGVDTRGRLLIAWSGPRGLSSLLLTLLPVFAGLPGSGQLFAICSLVVIASVILHGSSPMLLARAARRRASKEAAEAAGGEVARDFGPGPELPEDDAKNSREDSHSEQPAALSSRGVSSASPGGENRAARSTDRAASGQLGTGAEGAQIGPDRISL